MALEDQLLEDFRHLLPEQRNVVLDFVHFLRKKQEKDKNTDEYPQMALVEPIIALNNAKPMSHEEHDQEIEPSIAQENAEVSSATADLSKGTSFLEMAHQYVGILKDCPPDLSSNKAYLTDYGR